MNPGPKPPPSASKSASRRLTPDRGAPAARTVRAPSDVAAGPAATSARPRSYGRRRAIILASTILLILLHVMHWKVTGRTLAPLELNEAMYTFELGIVTAGFLMFALIALSTAIFGRFFCSWGCHILALEDLCIWILGKLRIRPKPVRSRLLLWVPPLTAGYMFLWPQIQRTWLGLPSVELHFASDEDGWASFLTTDFLRNLPGPGVSILTFVLCGFVIVYMLGSRSFCNYVCPYGAVFAMFERVAPGRIVASGNCTSCGRCTAACQSGIRVHEELQRFGTVINSACMRDLDCVAACPDGNPRFGFTRPPILRSRFGFARLRLPYDFDLVEELALAAVVLASLFALRGLYDTIPFFLALTIGAMLAYVFVLAARAFSRRDVRLNLLQIRRAGILTRGGHLFLLGVGCLFALLGHCAWIRLHEVRGRALLNEALEHARHRNPRTQAVLNEARAHLGVCERFGLWTSPQMQRDLAVAADLDGDERRCAELLQLAHDRSPSDLGITLTLGQSLSRSGRLEDASGLLRGALDSLSSCDFPRPAVRDFRFRASELLGEIEALRGRWPEARVAYETMLSIHPDAPGAHRGLEGALAELGQLEGAAEHLDRAVRAGTENGTTLYNRGRIELSLGRHEQAVREFRRSHELLPNDPDVLYNLGVALLETGRLEEAERELSRAVELAPASAAAHFSLARALTARGKDSEARRHHDRASALDPR